MSKILTEELIEQRLKDHGISMYDGDDNALAKLQEKYEFELTDSYNKDPDYSIYAETTDDALYDAMFDYNELIYVDDLDAYYVQDAVDRAWQTYVEEMAEEVENELIEEGYEWPVVESEKDFAKELNNILDS